MNLRDLAALDHAAILSDGADGFGWPVVVVAPSGQMAITTGFTSDVGEVIDPQSGMAVIGRRVTVQLLPGPIKTAGLGDVRAIADGNSKPWLVRFADVHGVGRTYKVMAVYPDQVLGSIRCDLESFTAG